MNHDDMIWQVIGTHFCSFKTTIGSAQSDNRQFCKHPYSITGLCNRSHCPLANSRYAVVRESEGKINLFLKTVERAHSPKNLWERISLSRNYETAMAQMDEHLAYFPKAIVHRNKQRLTKIHQYLIRMRKIKLKERAGKKQKLVTTNKKVDVRENRRERKALIAAKVEQSIEKELLERLAKGAYGDIYNFPEVPYQRALEDAEKMQEEEEEEESESEEEEEEEGLIEYVEDFDEEEEEEDLEDLKYAGDGKWTEDSGSSSEEDDSSDDDDDDDDSSEDEDDDSPHKKKDKSAKRKRPRGTRVEIEYEEEHDEQQQEQLQGDIAGMAW
mmetsp:Transcript_16567/g.20632  ORF Transcript_16567/g.20632 Transcript_16567/m.20632 type:complete len:327 (+) Transcript_16567:100-1080(+)|eukprot:CAMPEP_0172513910 /NCGR_PEP_ID=MMETSP1066-20121228/256386_1 /TAXON_ID=671091 /ORGANISM="Coscinodiscus wailesii, Strain CCMP2513" /LENGTH=326 /DNA_ID=CAMNT_0013294369 /DNA_START=100 /DNA_END=1080 /DNA_ORIENTATION=+